MGKTDTVIELLRHLPYLNEYSGDILAVQTAPYSTFWNFNLGSQALGDEGDRTKTYTEGPEFMDSVPAHVVGLSSGENDPLLFLLDTQLGAVYWLEAPGYVKDNDGSNLTLFCLSRTIPTTGPPKMKPTGETSHAGLSPISSYCLSSSTSN